MHSSMKCSGRWLFPPMTCKHLHQSWPSHVHTFFALFVIFHLAPTVEHAWLPRMKLFHPPENSCFWRSRWRSCTSQPRDNFCHTLSENDAYLAVGPKVGGGDRFSIIFFRQCLLQHGSQDMLWKKHPCSFGCQFLQTKFSQVASSSDFTFYSFIR